MESLCHIEPLLRKSTFPVATFPLSHIRQHPSRTSREMRCPSGIYRALEPSCTITVTEKALAPALSSLPGSSAERQACSACPAPNRSIKRTCLRQAAYVRRWASRNSLCTASDQGQ